MMIALVALGGAMGASLRFLIMGWVGSLTHHSFPFGTIMVNVVGSFLMGLLIAYLARHPMEINPEIRHLIGVGLLGGFTTFSAFSLDALTLFERGQILEMVLYVLFSVLLSLAAVFLGVVSMRLI